MNTDSGFCTTWEDEDMWLGYCDEYADYLTQGKTPEDLMQRLGSLHQELTGGHSPAIRYPREPIGPLQDEDMIFSLHLLGCVLLRSGGHHDWYENPRTKVYQPVPRCEKINKSLAKYILKQLS